MKKQLTKKLIAFIITAMMFSASVNAQFTCPCNSRLSGHCIKVQKPFPHYSCKNSGFRFSENEESESNLGESPFVIAYNNMVNTQISVLFSIEESHSISLQVFDVNGRLIKTLANKTFEEGEHEVIWNVENVNAGIYFLRMETLEYSENQKIIVQ